VVRMKVGQLIRRSPHPAPVGRPDYYRRELHTSLFVRSAKGLATRTFLPLDHSEPSAWATAHSCFDKHGVFPLNFSFPLPGRMPHHGGPRDNFLSTTIPGEPFSFDSWEDYLGEYQSAFFALSTKKGGWDTFRHVEILFSGGIPLMPGLGRSRPAALAHYPKRALSMVLESLIQAGPALPDDHTQEFFRQYSRQRLTTEAMATHLVEASGISGSRVLFLDRGLPQRTDYLSAFTLIGLRQALGAEVIPAWEVDYLFDDFTGDTSRLYGRGFGYTKVLPAALRRAQSLASPSKQGTEELGELVALAESCESIVVGNYDGNRDLVAALLGAGIPARRFVCIVGSDMPPDRTLRAQMRRSEMTFFVREFSAR